MKKKIIHRCIEEPCLWSKSEKKKKKNYHEDLDTTVRSKYNSVCHTLCKQHLSFVSEPAPCGSNMKTVNMLHYTFVKNIFGCMSQVPCYLRQCQVSVRVKSKQTDILAAIAGV